MYSKGDFIVDLQNEEKLFELQEEMIYRGEKGLYIGRAYDLKKKRQCYLKFTDDTGKNLANLKREESSVSFILLLSIFMKAFRVFRRITGKYLALTQSMCREKTYIRQG